MSGRLFVITAPSGAGKTSLIGALLKEDPRLKLSVSYTTRPPRPGEQDGREYHFVDDATFLAMRGRGEFLESAEVHGYRYGTSRKLITDTLAKGQDLVLEIDWQGAQQVKSQVPDAVSVFILPPSRAALEERMRKRGQDSEEVIARRMANAREEMSHHAEFDYLIVNEVFDTAVDEMCAIFVASRLRRTQQLQRHADLLQALLAEA